MQPRSSRSAVGRAAVARGCKRMRGCERCGLPSSAPASHCAAYCGVLTSSPPANALSSRPKSAACAPHKASPLSLPLCPRSELGVARGSLGAVDRGKEQALSRSRDSGEIAAPQHPTQRGAALTLTRMHPLFRAPVCGSQPPRRPMPLACLPPASHLPAAQSDAWPCWAVGWGWGGAQALL